MKTILKFPIYVEIVSDDTDRSKLTNSANFLLYSAMVDFLSNKNVRFEKSTLDEMEDYLGGVKIKSVQVLSQDDLVKRSIKKGSTVKPNLDAT